LTFSGSRFTSGSSPPQTFLTCALNGQGKATIRRIRYDWHPAEIKTMEDLLPKIRAAFQSSFDVDPQTITIDTEPSDIPGWDSMGHVTLVTNLEQIFELTFDVDELMAMENVKEICRVVESKLGKVASV